MKKYWTIILWIIFIGCTEKPQELTELSILETRRNFDILTWDISQYQGIQADEKGQYVWFLTTTGNASKVYLPRIYCH